MSTDPEPHEPDESTIAIRLRTEVRNWIRAVFVQHQRLTDPRWAAPEDADLPIPNYFADFQFMLVALVRLRRHASRLAEQVPDPFSNLKADLEAFDEALPALERMRNVGEHIDEYNLDQGRESVGSDHPDPVYRQQLQTYGFGSGRVTWLGQEFVAETALQAAKKLSAAFESAVRSWGHAPEATIRVGRSRYGPGTP